MRQLAIFPPLTVLCFAIVGAIIGVAVYSIAMFASGTIKTGSKALVLDVLLGAAGFIGGVFATVLIKVPPRTEVRHVGSVVIRETRTHFQHPYLVAITLAALLAIVHELLQWWAVRRSKSLPG